MSITTWRCCSKSRKLTCSRALVTIADINTELGEAYVAKLSSQGLKSCSRHRKPEHTSPVSKIFQGPICLHRCDLLVFANQCFQICYSLAGMGSIEIVIAVAGTVGEPFELFNKNERPSLERDPLPPSRLDRVIDVNLKGLCFTSQLAHYYFGLPSTSSENSSVRKSLTLIGSAISYSDFHICPDYSASKWVARGFSERLGY